MVNLRRKQAQMASALANTRETHSFHFLDLPSEIRSRIYSYIFAGNVVQVCSYNKDKTVDSFSIDERCQILLTNKLIRREAIKMFYWHSDWKFVKMSSLNYIAWGEGGYDKLKFVQKVIITNQDVASMFAGYLQFFPNLRVLVIDLPLKLRLDFALRPQHHDAVAKKIKNGDSWRNKIGPCLPVAKQRAFGIKLAVWLVYEGDCEPEQVTYASLSQAR